MKKERFKIIPTVYLILIKNKKILLLRRFNTGFWDGNYSLPAGHLDGGETIRQTMVRETKEEIGIRIDPGDLKLVHVMHRKEPKEERINFFLITKKWCGRPKIMEPHKCDDLKWFKLSNLPKNTIPYIKQVIKSSLNKIFYSEYGFVGKKKS